ncbi:DEAD/DEAH box helicase family protein, partial [Morganella morganii]|uniref:DEAD/DEAH box helicase family protein n=1 Tax=Morganella morganii TaxID=582 RepID=UPI001482D668
NERSAFIAKNKLRFLREYQKKAINAIQDMVADGSTRFLFEMATGTGKTLTSAAVIKLLNERSAFIAKNKLRFLREYQKKAINAIQDMVADG